MIMTKNAFRASIPQDERLTITLSFLASGKSICSNTPTLNGGFPFWEDSFHPSGTVILTWMSNIYDFFKSITLFIKTMWKSWLLRIKLGVCVTLVHHLQIVTLVQHLQCQQKRFLFWPYRKKSQEEFENQYNL